MDECPLDIVASTTGLYQFLNNLQLVSVVLWVRPGAPGRFRQQLTVEIQDFTMRTNSTKFLFMRAFCSHAGLKYSIDDCYKIGERLLMNEEKVDCCLMYLHECVSTLMYYPSIGDKFRRLRNLLCSNCVQQYQSVCFNIFTHTLFRNCE